MPTREQVRGLLDSGLDYQAASRRSRLAAAVSGGALLAASAATRWGIYRAGLASASDPAYTVVPQRQRLNERALANGRGAPAA